MPDQPRRPRTLNDARTEAEAAFRKTTTKVAEAPPKKTALPGVKELVSLRIDQDVLEHFQEAGPGWQDRINEALRKAAGKSWGGQRRPCAVPTIKHSARKWWARHPRAFRASDRFAHLSATRAQAPAPSF